MHPWLLYSEGFKLPTYFTCLMVGFALATFVLRREALRSGLRPRVVMDLALLLVPGSVVGSRIAHILLVEPATFLANPGLLLRWDYGGFVFYGGFVAGALILVAWARWHRLDAWTLADVCVPAVAFGLIFGRLGCLGAGCCFGRPADFGLGPLASWGLTEVPWAVRYFHRGHLPEGWVGTALHPAPLYASLFAAALFVVLTRLRARQRFVGEATLAFIGLYGLGRAMLEVFRADFTRGMYLGGWLSTSQIIGLVSAFVALGLLWGRRRGIPSGEA